MWSSRLTLIALASLALLVLVPHEAAAATTGGLYVTESASGDSTNVESFQIGSLDNELQGPLGVGVPNDEPYGLAITPNDRYLYVTNANSASTISEYSVDPSSGSLEPLAPAAARVDPASGANPSSIAVDPTGSWAFTANPGSQSVTSLRINPTNGVLTPVQEYVSNSELTLEEPTGVAVDPSGRYLYVTDETSGNVDEFSINLTTGALTPLGSGEGGGPSVSMPETEGQVAPGPARITTATIGGNEYAFVTDANNDEVVEFTIDSSSGALSEAGWANPSEAYLPTGTAPTGDDPLGLSVDSANESLYVGASSVDYYTIDPTTGALGAPTFFGDPGTASGVAIAPDGKELYAGNDGADDDFITLYTVAGDGTLTLDESGGEDQVPTAYEPATPLAAALPTAPSPPATAPAGTLAQLPYPNDCITSDFDGSTSLMLGCNYQGAPPPANSMLDSYQPIVSPDGHYAYVVSPGGDLDEFSRDPSNGALAYIGCVSANSDCGAGYDDLAGANGPQEMAISPDGTSAYAVTTDNGEGALVEFTRDPSTGLLTWQGCFSQTDTACTHSVGLANPYGVTVSPDGENVYATSNDPNYPTAADDDSSVIEFSRNAASGALSPVAGNDCITTNSANPGNCQVVAPASDSGDLLYPLTVHVSPDGNNVYVAAGGTGGAGGDISEFARNPATGALSFIPASTCITTGSANYPNCTTTNGIGFDGGTEDLTISPDGLNVYANAFADNGVIELRRDPATGVLTQLAAPNACIAEETSPAGSPSCTQPAYPQQFGTGGALGVAISPDGLSVYVSGAGDNAVASFSRDPSTGALTPLALPFGCISGAPEYVAGTCPNFNTNGLYSPRRLIVSPDGANVYVADQTGVEGVGGDGIVELARTAPTADLGVSVSSPAAAVYGSQFSYTITATNNGPSAEYQPLVANALPPGVSYVASTTSQGTCTGTTMLSCNIGWMTNGETVTITVTVTATATGQATDGATTSPTGDVVDPNDANNTATHSTTIAPAPLTADVAGAETYGGVPSFLVDGYSGLVNGDGTGVVSGALSGCQTSAVNDGVGDHSGTISGCGGLAATNYTISYGDNGFTITPAPLTITASSGSMTAGGVVPAVTPSYSGFVNGDGPASLTTAPACTTTATPTSAPGSVQTTSCSGAADPNYAISYGAGAMTVESAPTTQPGPAPTPIPTPTLTPPVPPAGESQSVPPPVLDSSIDAVTLTGSVFVKLPGTNTFVRLSSLRSIPMGSVINATHGTVQITVALPNGTIETGDFYDGEFIVTQNSSGRVFETLTGGSFVGCPTAASKTIHAQRFEAASAKKKRATVVRELWGSAHGDFTTKGRYGAAAVSGTIWLTQDRCEGTYFNVTKDTIVVTAFASPHRHHHLKQGQSFVIFAPGF